MQVDFYVLADESAIAAQRLACRLADKAFASHQRLLIYSNDAELLQELDALLWTFADRAFLPHESVAADATHCEAPILLSTGLPLAAGRDLLLNLAVQVPAAARDFTRVLEIVAGRATDRELSRQRFRQYRDWGYEPATHRVSI